MILGVAGLDYVDPANVPPGPMFPSFLGMDLGAGISSGPLAFGVGGGFDLGAFYGPNGQGGSVASGAVDGKIEARLVLTLPGVMVMAIPYWGGTAFQGQPIRALGVDLRTYIAPEQLGGVGFYGKLGYVTHDLLDERTDEVAEQFSTLLFQVGVGFGTVATNEG